jgi:hypothetical protein
LLDVAMPKSEKLRNRATAHARLEAEGVNQRKRPSPHIRVRIDATLQPDGIALHVPSDPRVVVPEVVVERIARRDSVVAEAIFLSRDLNLQSGIEGDTPRAAIFSLDAIFDVRGRGARQRPLELLQID